MAEEQGIEPRLSGLESDVQPLTLFPLNGAGEENRTPIISLEG